jgi:tetratricopeptide (TPR) repeat protein
LEESLALSQASGDQWSMAAVLNVIGMVAHESGAYGKAEEAYEKSLAIQRAIGDQDGAAGTLLELGLTCWVQGCLEKSERLLKEGIALFQETHNHTRLAYGYQKLGEALMLGGKLEQAQSAAAKGLAIAQNLGSYYDIAANHQAVAHVETHLGNYEQTIAHAQTSLDMNREGGFLWGIAFAQFMLSLSKLGKATYDQAWQRLEESIAGFRTISHHENLGWALALSPYAARGLGQFAQARQHLAEALHIVADLGVFVPLMYGLPAAALLLADADQQERAVEVYALASRYPFVANSRWFEEVAGKHIAQVAAELPPQVVAAAQTRGQERDVDTAIEELLTELNGATEE